MLHTKLCLFPKISPKEGKCHFERTRSSTSYFPVMGLMTYALLWHITDHNKLTVKPFALIFYLRLIVTWIFFGNALKCGSQTINGSISAWLYRKVQISQAPPNLLKSYAHFLVIRGGRTTPPPKYVYYSTLWTFPPRRSSLACTSCSRKNVL